MSETLFRYRFDYSTLSPEEFEKLEKRIDNVSWTALAIDRNDQIGEFFLPADQSAKYIEYLNVPAACNLRRV